MKKKSIITALFLATIWFGQAQQLSQKVGTNPTLIQPSAVLEVESTTKGFLPPRMTEVQMNAIATSTEGLIVYCTDCTPKGLYNFDGTDWSAIGGAAAPPPPPPSVVSDCDVNGFVGAYVNGIATSGTTFSVTITNNSFSVATLAFQNSDLVLSGVTGLIVGTPTPTSATLNAGQSQLVSYPITGTPGAGTLTGTWSKLSLNCVKTKNIAPGNATLRLPAGSTVVSICQGVGCSQINIQGVVDNTANKKIVNVAYTGGFGSYGAYTSDWITSNSGTGEGGDTNSFRISYPAGTFSASGSLPVTIEVDGDGSFNAKKISAVTTLTIATIPLNINGNYKGDITLKIVPCEAPTSSGEFLVFKCHNLGADESADPFIPSWQLNGAYFQWGKKPVDTNSDGYRTKPNSVTEGFAAAPTGSTAGTANDAAVTNWSTTTAANGAWNVTEATPIKTANDPCPSGYRVPTRNEWVSIYSTTPVNTQANWSTVGTYTNSPTNYSAGKNVNNSLYLPASGYRGNSNSALNDRGSNGYYWSSTVSDTYAYYLSFLSGNNVYTGFYERVSGYSVRCVAE